jgi:hypothetical protein
MPTVLNRLYVVTVVSHFVRLLLCAVLVSPTVASWAIAPLKQYTQAVGVYRAGQYPQAYQQFANLMQAHPEDVRLPYYMALTSVRLGKLEQAQRFYEVVLSIAPKSLVAPYAKQGLALLTQAQQPPTLDAPPSVGAAVMPQSSITTPTGTTQRNTLVAEWQKRHPPIVVPATPANASFVDANKVIPQTSSAITSQSPPPNAALAMPSLSIPTVSAVVPPSAAQSQNTVTEVSITPAMVMPTKTIPIAPTVAIPTLTDANTTAAQQQQQLMQTMMMMQLMNGAGGGNNSGGSNSNPMAMMMPLMMMQQQNAATAGTNNNLPQNPFGGLDPKTMSDLMTQGMMNNLDLFSDSKKNNDN